jgi:hypothetical protein
MKDKEADNPQSDPKSNAADDKDRGKCFDNIGLHGFSIITRRALNYGKIKKYVNI